MDKTSFRVLTLTVGCMLLLSITAQQVMAWPCPPCPDCYTCTPTGCEYDCGTGETCCGGSCCNDKCWDTYTAILGSISVQNAELCEQKTHTSSISDTDHWFLGGDGHGYPSDTVTYSWSQTAGTNPQTGTFIGDTNDPSVVWKAPPCTGTVNFKLTANDKPDSMDNPCPSSTRDDGPKDFEGTSTVSLPPGCSIGTKSVSLQSQIVGTPTCPSGTCGATEMTGLSAPIEAKYNNCKWVFQVTALADVLSGACPSNYCNIVNGNESCINKFTYCGIVHRFKHMDGCVTMADGSLPSNTGCTEIHEAKHYEIFETQLAAKESWLLGRASMNDITIDCEDPNTTSCQAAKAARQSAIQDDIETAYLDAYSVAADEGPPVEAAKPCFSAIADLICTHAQSEGWPSCSYCP